MTNLNLSEQTELESLEKIIETGVGVVYRAASPVLQALKQIEEKELYRAEYKTFPEYMRGRWSKSHYYRLMDALKVQDSPIGEMHLPESHLRETAGLATNIRQEIHERTTGMPAREVRKIAAKVKQDDDFDAASPEKQRQAIARDTKAAQKRFQKRLRTGLIEKLGKILSRAMAEAKPIAAMNASVVPHLKLALDGVVAVSRNSTVERVDKRIRQAMAIASRLGDGFTELVPIFEEIGRKIAAAK